MTLKIQNGEEFWTVGRSKNFPTFVLRCSRWSAFLESGRVSPFLPKNRNFPEFFLVKRKFVHFFHLKSTPSDRISTVGNLVSPIAWSQSEAPPEEQQREFDSKVRRSLPQLHPTDMQVYRGRF